MKKKLHISRLITLFGVVTATSLSLGSAIVNSKATFIVDETSYYTITYEGHKFRCYKIDDSENPTAKKVSIAWLWTSDNSNPQTFTNNTLNIPEKVTIEEQSYDVSAIYKAGFRSCEFQKIVLPVTIEEIGEEAFAYCLNLTEFTIPHSITKIAPSTFMDCQNLEVFYYTTAETDPETHIVTETKKLGNSTIKEIGDHAFDNCKKLKGLYFPSSLISVGNSAFQRCELLQSLYFPSDNQSLDEETRNYISVGAYAFADCPILNTVYFEPNMNYIGPYAFANDKEDLEFTYTGSETAATFDSRWENWRKKNITTSTDTVYDFIGMQQPVHIDDEYPGLIYSFETAVIKLNSAKNNTPTVELDSNPGEYVKINGFQEPFTSLPGYYDVTTKTFTIPNTVKGKTVKVIGNTALAGLPLQHVIFNHDLVQIQTRAFYGCNSITSLEFSNCKHLKEISYEIFQSPCPELESMKTPDKYNNDQVYNNSLHTIALPSCLEYIGDSAFYNFISLTGGITFKLPDPDNPTGPVPESKLKVIGDFAFSVHRSKNLTQTNLIDIELPNSLNDAAYEAANYYHPYTPSWNAGDTLRKNRYAVGRFCFENQDIIGTVTMQKATTAQANDSSYRTSFMTNAFVRCNNISKFKSNENLFLIGADTFKLCPSLKEVFLYGKKANDAGVHFAWGITDQGELQGGVSTYTNGMFSRNNNENGNVDARPDTVIYVHESAAPGRLDNEALCKSGVPMWNSDITNTLTTGMAYNDSAAGQTGNKKKMPTFYNSNWEDDPTTVANDINVYYWKPGTSTDSYAGTIRPTSGSGDYEYTLASHEYNEGYIAFAPSPTSGKYTVAKYFTDGASGNYKDEINLTNIANTYVTNFSSKLDTIAGCAFADGNNKNRGVFFVLPSGITTIEDRAFYRKSSSSTSVKIVTYKDGGTIKVPTGETTAYDTLISNWSKKTYNYNDTNGGYCVLPTGMKKIMSNSFFNNRFKTIELNSDLEFLGASAFAVPAYTNLQTSLIFTPGAGSKFSVGTGDAAGGIYYTANANKKMLVFQIGGAANSTLVIDSGTKAIGFRSMIRTNYKTVNIQTGLTTIYGQAFYNNKSIVTFGGALSSLKYISARVDNNDPDGDTEVYNAYDGTFPFDNYDVTHIANWGPTYDTYINAYRVGAFDGADNMTTIDFTQMTSIKKIGEKAFQNCKKLQYLTGTGANEKTYTFIDYSGKNSTQTADITSKTDSILDLSNCTKLKSVSTNAFKEVKIPIYTILPNTTGKTIDTESTITLANDSNVLPPSSKRLIGDTWHQAGLNSNNSTLKPRVHYPSNALRGNEQYVFYRFFMDGFPTGVTINDYVTTSGTAASLMQYWTIYNNEYYLFKGPKQVLKFYELVTADTYTRGQALGYTED